MGFGDRDESRCVCSNCQVFVEAGCSVIDNYEIKLRCVLDLAVSTFALDHPLPRFDTFPSAVRRASRGGGRDERWRKFVGSISGLESFSSKRLTKNWWRKCNGARALKSKQSLLQLHTGPLRTLMFTT